MTNVLQIPGGWAGMELIEPLLLIRSDVHNHFVIISGEKSCSFQAFCLLDYYNESKNIFEIWKNGIKIQSSNHILLYMTTI